MSTSTTTGTTTREVEADAVTPSPDPTPGQTVVTPTVGGFFRRIRFWIVAAAFIAIVVLVYTLLTPPSLTNQALSPTGTGLTGSRALVQVLGQHGVAVTSTTNLEATKSAIHDSAATTLFVYDPSRYLDSEQLQDLPDLAAHVVVLSPATAQLTAFDSQVTLVGTSTASPVAHCDLPAAKQAGQLADGGHAYRVAAGASGFTRCFPSGDNDYSLVQSRSGYGTNTSTLTIVGATKAFTNQYIADRGNAALAINLLGQSRNLVWYLPSIEDVGAGGNTETLSQAAPAWFPALAVLVLLVVIAAAVWRGRRFGPLVVEQMPVVVRSSETMEGRARLYQSSSARVRALDSLRIGTITRIGSACGLPHTADVADVAAVAASSTGRSLASVRDILLDGTPQTDSDLVRFSDALIELETDVTQAARAS